MLRLVTIILLLIAVHISAYPETTDSITCGMTFSSGSSSFTTGSTEQSFRGFVRKHKYDNGQLVEVTHYIWEDPNVDPCNTTCQPNMIIVGKQDDSGTIALFKYSKGVCNATREANWQQMATNILSIGALFPTGAILVPLNESCTAELNENVPVPDQQYEYITQASFPCDAEIPASTAENVNITVKLIGCVESRTGRVVRQKTEWVAVPTSSTNVPAVGGATSNDPAAAIRDILIGITGTISGIGTSRYDLDLQVWQYLDKDVVFNENIDKCLEMKVPDVGICTKRPLGDYSEHVGKCIESPPPQPPPPEPSPPPPEPSPKPSPSPESGFSPQHESSNLSQQSPSPTPPPPPFDLAKVLGPVIAGVFTLLVSGVAVFFKSLGLRKKKKAIVQGVIESIKLINIAHHNPEMSEQKNRMIKKLSFRVLSAWNGPFSLYALTEHGNHREPAGIWKTKYDNKRSSTIAWAILQYDTMLWNEHNTSLLYEWYSSRHERKKAVKSIINIIANIDDVDLEFIERTDIHVV